MTWNFLFLCQEVFILSEQHFQKDFLFQSYHGDTTGLVNGQIFREVLEVRWVNFGRKRDDRNVPLPDLNGFLLESGNLRLEMGVDLFNRWKRLDLFAGVNWESQSKINEDVLVDILNECFQGFGNLIWRIFHQRNYFVQKIQDYDSLFILNKSTESCSIHVENLVGNLVGFFGVIGVSREFL